MATERRQRRLFNVETSGKRIERQIGDTGKHVIAIGPSSSTVDGRRVSHWQEQILKFKLLCNLNPNDFGSDELG